MSNCESEIPFTPVSALVGNQKTRKINRVSMKYGIANFIFIN